LAEPAPRLAAPFGDFLDVGILGMVWVFRVMATEPGDQESAGDYQSPARCQCGGLTPPGPVNRPNDSAGTMPSWCPG